MQNFALSDTKTVRHLQAVSYTHLDVYKRQEHGGGHAHMAAHAYANDGHFADVRVAYNLLSLIHI